MAPTAAQVQAVERLVHESVGAVDALSSQALRSVLPALAQARDELRNDLYRWLANAPDGHERFTAYQRTQALRALEAAMGRIEDLEPAMARALGGLRRETGVLAVQNLDHEVQRLSAIFGGGVPTIPQIQTAAVIAEGNHLLWKRHATSARRYAGQLGDDLRHQFAVGLAKGETFEQLTQRMRKLGPMPSARPAGMGALAADISDSMFHRWRYATDRLVRTEAMHAYNVQHDISIVHANENRDPDDEEYLRRWDASADKVTCERCKELDRTVTTIDGVFKGGIKSPPLHPHCRCVVLAWLARWGNMKGEVPSKDAEGRDIAPTPDKPPKPQPETSLPQRGKPVVESMPMTPASSALTNRLGWEFDREVTRTTAGAEHGEFTERMLRRDGKRRVAVVQMRIDQPRPKPLPQQAPQHAEPVAAIPPGDMPPKERKNPKRVEAARKAGLASQERKREIYGAVKTALPRELAVAWEQEGAKFMREQSKRIKGIKDPINAAAKMSEAFMETYGSGAETAFGNEGDRYYKRAELEAKHAELWADEQTRKHYEQLEREHAHAHAEHEDEWSTPTKKGHDDDDPPF